MPPCLGSSAVAAVKEAATISSDVATTDPCARRIANPPYSSAALPHFFRVPPWMDFSIHNSRPPRSVNRPPHYRPGKKLLRKSPRWQGVLTRLVNAPMRLERLAHLQRQFGLMSASLAIFSQTPS